MQEDIEEIKQQMEIEKEIQVNENSSDNNCPTNVLSSNRRLTKQTTFLKHDVLS